MLQIVRKKLTPDEITPPDVRYNPDCDCTQSTWDGGATWVDNPGVDPRTAPQYQAPGISTSDPACDGAARIAAALKRSIDKTVATSNAVQLASALLDVFLFIVPVIGIIAEAIYIAALALLAIGTAAIDAAFTSDVYDEFKCIAYCHLNSMGQFTTEAWEAFQTDCFTHFGIGTVSDVLQINFDTLGIVGFNNAVSVGTETGDCSACPGCAWCWEWDESEIYEATSWTINDHIVGAYTVAEASAGFSATITKAVFVFEYRPNDGSTYVDGGGAIYGDDYPTTPIANDPGQLPPGGTVTFENLDGLTLDQMTMYCNSWYDGGANYPLMVSIHLEGIGTIPAFANGTDCT
jgi:hypothetical protein